MTPAIASKLPKVGTTIFTVMSQMAAEHGAVNLSQGFPDFAAPAELLALVDHYMRAGLNQYAPMAGVPALREAIAAKTRELYGAEVDPDTGITVTSGATEALFDAVAAVVRNGDEVVLLDPAYDAYEPAVELSGGKPVHVPLCPPDYGIDWERLESAIGPRTRLLMINSPHNPTGAVLGPEDMIRLEGLLKNTDVLLVSDEVYEHILFDGAAHQSVLRYPGLAERAFVVSSFGKVFHVTGWKIGYCIAPKALSAEFRKIHQYVTFATVAPMQYALADFLKQYPERYRELPAFYQTKRDRFCRLLEGSRMRFTPTRGTYFQLLDYGAVSDLRDVDYAAYLTREKGVASIPISVFSARPPDSRVLRFCFCKDDRTLEKGAEILRRL